MIVLFLKNLFLQLKDNGKLLLGYLLTQVPELTNFPGLTTAIETALNDLTLKSFIELAIQILLAGAAGHRVVKVMRNAQLETISENRWNDKKKY